jgi:hypothetical protein
VEIWKKERWDWKPRSKMEIAIATLPCKNMGGEICKENK